MIWNLCKHVVFVLFLVNTFAFVIFVNIKEWKENVMIVLGNMDLDLALRIEQPATLMDKCLMRQNGTVRSGIAQIA